MRLARLASTAVLRDSLLDPPARDRTIRADVIGLEVVHPLEDRLADLHRIGEELALHAPRAVVSGAPLDGVERRAGNPLEHLAGFLADVLNAGMAGDVITDFAERPRERPVQQAVACA